MQPARQAEGIDFEGICLSDHLCLGASPFVPLAVLAPCTSTIQLGTAVLNIDTWTPLPLATEVATLLGLSGSGSSWESASVTTRRRGQRPVGRFRP